MGDEVPEGLHNVQYGLKILEDLGWPAKTNSELMCDCLTAIQKSKRLSGAQAYKYMARAIKLAKEQGQKVDKIWLMNGDYMSVRPPREVCYEYEPTDWQEVKRHQSTPEFEAAWKEMQEKCAKAFGIPIKKGASAK